MHGYSQPSAYRFSHDSIELAQRVVADTRQVAVADLKGRSSVPVRLLDLCAGCGVVGLEIVRRWPPETAQAVAVDFNEVQAVYQPFFDRNLEWIKNSLHQRGPQFESRWIQRNYAELLDAEFAGAYDVVVSNPPYFDRSQGKLPPSDFKARCRFFIDSDFETLLKVTAHCLKPGGQAYILVRDLDDHGLQRSAVLDQIWASLGTWCSLDSVRGTGLIRFTRGTDS